jgi:hypothetical protein
MGIFSSLKKQQQQDEERQALNDEIAMLKCELGRAQASNESLQASLKSEDQFKDGKIQRLEEALACTTYYCHAFEAQLQQDGYHTKCQGCGRAEIRKRDLNEPSCGTYCAECWQKRQLCEYCPNNWYRCESTGVIMVGQSWRCEQHIENE